jgi:hypothetical protein
MAGDGQSQVQSQYIELPDSTPTNPKYGEFPADMPDKDIHYRLMMTYPEHFNVRPGNMPVPTPTMHKSYLMGNPDRDPEAPESSVTNQVTGMVKGAVGPAARLTRAGYEGMAHSVTGRPYQYPGGMPQLSRDARDTAIGMVTAGASDPVGEIDRPVQSAPPPETTGIPRSRAAGRSPASGGGAGSTGIMSDIGDLLTPKWAKAVKILRKAVTGGYNNTPTSAVTESGPITGTVLEPETVMQRSNAPFQTRPRAYHPVNADTSPVTQRALPPARGGAVISGPRTPLWRQAQPTTPQLDVPNPFDTPAYRNASRTLTREPQGGANYTAEDLKALKARHGITDNPTGTMSPETGGAVSKLRRASDQPNIIGQATAKSRTPGEPIQHGFNFADAEDLLQKSRTKKLPAGTGAVSKLQKRAQ